MTGETGVERNIGTAIGVVILWHLTAGSPQVGAQEVPERPNVILILADDLGWRDLGCYGSPYHETPEIDRLASRGIRFTQAYSANPLCSPTRASILTGLYPARIGITAPACHQAIEVLEKGLEPPRPGQRVRVARSLTRLKPEYVTLAEVLAEKGYITAHFGKWHLGHSGPYEPKDQGFAFDWPHTPAAAGPGGGYLAPWRFIRDSTIQAQAGEHIEDRMSAEAARFIREHADRPFYVNYWCYSVHSPWSAKPDLVDYFARKVDETSPQRNPVYAAMVKSLDEAVGRIVRAVDEAGLSTRTIIVFFSDNGGFAYPPRSETSPPGYADVPATSNAPLRSGKASIYEGGTRVPCIVVWPGKVHPGSVSHALVSSVDLFPTLLEMCGIEPPNYPIDGISQVPALLGKEEVRKEVFCHFPHGNVAQSPRIDGLQPSAYLRQGDWKLIRFFADGPNGEDRFELYNLREDLGESHNLALQEPERVRQMAERLARYLQETEAVIPVFNPEAKTEAASQVDPFLGWKARGCSAEIKDGLLHLKKLGPTPFLGYSVGQIRGPLEVRFHMRVSVGGTGKVEWLPPPERKPLETPYTIEGGGFRTVAVEIPHQGPIGIVRIYLPPRAESAELSWIELKAGMMERRFQFR